MSGLYNRASDLHWRANIAVYSKNIAEILSNLTDLK